MARFLRKTLQISTGDSAASKPIYLEFSDADIGAFAYNVNYIWFSSYSDGGIYSGSYVSSPLAFDWATMEIVNGVFTFKGWVRSDADTTNLTLYLFTTNDAAVTIYPNYYARYNGSVYISKYTWDTAYNNVYHLNNSRDAVSNQDVISAAGTPGFTADSGVFDQEGCFTFNDDGYLHDNSQLLYGRECFFKPAAMTAGEEYVVFAIGDYLRASLIPQSPNFYFVEITESHGIKKSTANTIYLSPDEFHHLALCLTESGGAYAYKAWLNGNKILDLYGHYPYGGSSQTRIGGSSITVSVMADQYDEYADQYGYAANYIDLYGDGSVYQSINNRENKIWHTDTYNDGTSISPRWVISPTVGDVANVHWVSETDNLASVYYPKNDQEYGGIDPVSVTSPTKNFVGQVDEVRMASYAFNDEEYLFDALFGVSYFNSQNYTPAIGPAEYITHTIDLAMSGGVSVSGTAAMTSRTYSQVASGGIAISGESVVVQQWEPEVLSGITVGGHAAYVHPPVVPTGGVLSGGESPYVASWYTEGGVVHGGEATIWCRYLADLPVSLAIQPSGENTTIWNNDTTGIALVSGASLNSHSYGPLGGVSIQGEMFTELICDVQTEGGISASGDSFVDPYIMFGQILAGGEASIEILYNGIETGGGIQIDGVGITSMNLVVEGGVVLDATPAADYIVSGTTSPSMNGSYNEAGTYNGKPYYVCLGTGTIWWAGNYWALSQALDAGEFSWIGPVEGLPTGIFTYVGPEGQGSGIASVTIGVTEWKTNFPEASGGLSIYSDAEHAIVTPFWDTAEGGISIDGIAVVDPEVGYGGVATSGAAEVVYVHVPLASEYVWANHLTGGEVVPPDLHTQSGWASCSLNPETNLFTWYTTFSFPTVRYIRIKGPAAEAEESDTIQLYVGQLSGPDYSTPISGNATITEVQKADLLAGLWYWDLMSNDNEDLRGQIEVRNGVDIGGSAALVNNEFAEGGIQSSGETVLFAWQHPVVSGGAIGSGDGVVDVQQGAVVLGGCQIGGAADVFALASPVIEGGGKANGSSIEQTQYNLLPEGGMAANSGAIVGIGPAVSGGMAASPDHIELRLMWPRPEGGLVTAPAHTKTFFDWYISEGAVVVGGVFLPAKIQIWETRHLGYGRCMGSENIFTKVTYDALLTPPTNDVSPELEDERFRIQHEPGWCEVEDRCEQGVLPDVVQRRQGEHLPPKIERVTKRDRGIARAAL